MTSWSPVSNYCLVIGIHGSGSVLSWLKSYLSSRCFRVKCETGMSSWHTSSCGVPQGSVLGPLLFVIYTTLLSIVSTPISSFSLDHHLQSSTQMTPSSFFLQHGMDHLHNALDRILSWMTANLLTLNSPKNEFLLTGLSKFLLEVVLQGGFPYSAKGQALGAKLTEKGNKFEK